MPSEDPSRLLEWLKDEESIMAVFQLAALGFSLFALGFAVATLPWMRLYHRASDRAASYRTMWIEASEERDRYFKNWMSK